MYYLVAVGLVLVVLALVYMLISIKTAIAVWVEDVFKDWNSDVAPANNYPVFPQDEKSLYLNRPALADAPTPSKIKVFISYKTREHQQYVAAIAKALEGAGFSVWLDAEQSVPNIRSMGLDFSVISGLKQADVMLFLVAQKSYQSLLWQKLLDGMDFVVFILGTKYGGNIWPVIWEVQIRWNNFKHGVNLSKRLDENWQEWEARVANDLGIPIVRACLTPDGQATSDVIEGTYLLKSQCFETELWNQVIPELRQKHLGRKRLPITPQAQELVPTFKLLLTYGLTVLLFLGFILEIVDTIKEAIAWLPNLILNTIKSGLSKIRKSSNHSQSRT